MMKKLLSTIVCGAFLLTGCTLTLPKIGVIDLRPVPGVSYQSPPPLNLVVPARAPLTNAGPVEL